MICAQLSKTKLLSMHENGCNALIKPLRVISKNVPTGEFFAPQEVLGKE